MPPSTPESGKGYFHFANRHTREAEEGGFVEGSGLEAKGVEQVPLTHKRKAPRGVGCKAAKNSREEDSDRCLAARDREEDIRRVSLKVGDASNTSTALSGQPGNADLLPRQLDRMVEGGAEHLGADFMKSAADTAVL